jgi:hypothetical protein
MRRPPDRLRYHVTEQHPKVGTRMLTEPIQASYAASRYIPPPLKSVRYHVTEQHPKVGTRMLTGPIQASYAASRYSLDVSREL